MQSAKEMFEDMGFKYKECVENRTGKLVEIEYTDNKFDCTVTFTVEPKVYLVSYTHNKKVRPGHVGQTLNKAIQQQIKEPV